MSKIVLVFVVLAIASFVASFPQPGAENEQKISTCVLRKSFGDGLYLQVNKSRAEVGENEFQDFEELCPEGEDGRIKLNTFKTITG